jgi:phosphatidylinositol phospholipase C, delta
MLTVYVLMIVDLGYMINHSMFLCKGQTVLKPAALREPSKELLSKRANHVIEVTVRASFHFE